MALFESFERRIDKINEVLGSYGIGSLEEAEKITKDAGLNVYDMIKGIQPICCENACWAYTVGAAIAIKEGCRGCCRYRRRPSVLLYPWFRSRSEKGWFGTWKSGQNALRGKHRLLLLFSRA